MSISYVAIVNKENKTLKKGLYSIYIRIGLSSEYKYLRLDHKVELSSWDGKDRRWVRASHPFAFEINALISRTIDSLYGYELKQRNMGNHVTLAQLKDYFERGQSSIFNDWVREFVRRSLRGKALNTLKLYNTLVSHLDEFNPAIQFNQLDEKLLHGFAYWLQENKAMAGITVHKYCNRLKMLGRRAYMDRIIPEDPFYGCSVSESGIRPTKSKRRVYLEIDEIALLKKAELPTNRPDLELARLHWLMCFYAGFYYSDLKHLKWTNVKNSEYGYCIVGNRYKNEEQFIAPIHMFAHAVHIIELQRGKDPVYVFPEAISEQKYNSKLKELAEIAGIKKNLMNKSARHSLIQYWEARGLATAHIAKMVGHTRESTTQEYFDLSMRNINEQVSKFEKISL